MSRGLKNLFSAALGLGVVALTATVASACPMCNQSIAGQDQLPHAYMYSILFMLGMPATVFVGIGGAIYLKFRKFYATAAVGVPDSIPDGQWQNPDDVPHAA